MMEPDGGPLDAVSAAALVARVVSELLRSSEEDKVVLLSDLLCAAWPTRRAQEQ
jgi:hypothetical protein